MCGFEPRASVHCCVSGLRETDKEGDAAYMHTATLTLHDNQSGIPPISQWKDDYWEVPAGDLVRSFQDLSPSTGKRASVV